MASKTLLPEIDPDNHADAPRARSIIATAPRLISQHTAQATLGIPTRRLFFDLCREFTRDGGRVGARGKLRFVDAEKFSAWLLEREKRANTHEAGDFLAELGLKAVG